MPAGGQQQQRRAPAGAVGTPHRPQEGLQAQIRQGMAHQQDVDEGAGDELEGASGAGETVDVEGRRIEAGGDEIELLDRQPDGQDASLAARHGSLRRCRNVILAGNRRRPLTTAPPRGYGSAIPNL